MCKNIRLNTDIRAEADFTVHSIELFADLGSKKEKLRHLNAKIEKLLFPERTETSTREKEPASTSTSASIKTNSQTNYASTSASTSTEPLPLLQPPIPETANLHEGASVSSNTKEETATEASPSVQPSVVKKPKRKMTKESYAQKNARYQASHAAYMRILAAAQPLEESIVLEDSRIDLLKKRTTESLIELTEFLKNPRSKYNHNSFESWIKSLGGKMKGATGSQWTVTLPDIYEFKQLASIHIPHGGFDSLDKISRSNLLFLLQRTGFIKWNR